MANKSSKIFPIIIRLWLGFRTSDIPMVSLTHFVKPNKSLNLSMPQFPHLECSRISERMALVFIAISGAVQCWVRYQWAFPILKTSLPLEGGGRVEMKSCSFAFLSPTGVIQKFWRFFEGNFLASHQPRFKPFFWKVSQTHPLFVYKVALITPTSQGCGDN